MHKFVLAGALLFAAVGVHAQTSNDNAPSSKQFAVKLGVHQPADGDDGGLGHDWFAAGIEYAFPKQTTAEEGAVPFVYLDYNNKSHTGFFFDPVFGPMHIKYNSSSIGLGAGLRIYGGHKSDAVRGYFDGGFGIYDNRLSENPQDGVLAGQTYSKTQGNLGFKLGLGVELKQGLFAEVEYANEGSVDLGNGFDPVRFAGTNIMGGIRF